MVRCDLPVTPTRIAMNLWDIPPLGNVDADRVRCTLFGVVSFKVFSEPRSIDSDSRINAWVERLIPFQES
jgi:hypothetical protein